MNTSPLLAPKLDPDFDWYRGRMVGPNNPWLEGLESHYQSPMEKKHFKKGKKALFVFLVLVKARLCSII